MHLRAACNFCVPGVGVPEVHGDRKEACDVGNKLPREGHGRRNLSAGWRCWNRGVNTLDHLLDELGLSTRNFEIREALAGVKIFQHVQEELVEQPVLARGSVEGHLLIVFWIDAVCCDSCVVLLVVEQAACTKSQVSCAFNQVELSTELKA